MVFGFGSGNYQTSNNAAHNSKPISSIKTLERSYGANVILGADTSNYQSEAKNQFAHKESGYQSVDKNRVLDFKAAHFKVGFPEEESRNLSEAQANYGSKPLTVV